MAKVRVFDAAINSMFGPGGEVFKENGKIVREIRIGAVARAPSRTGAVKRGHRAAVTPGNFNKKTTGTVYNIENHAIYPHEGTTGPIRSSRPGGRLLVRLAPFSRYVTPNFRKRANGTTGMRRPGVLRDSVKGQRAQHWITDAANAVLARYGVRI